jgi:phosphoserine phosphatase
MRPVREPVILAVTGPDRPGILAELAAVLAAEGIELVDIEQATLQSFLALSFLVDLGGQPERAQAVLTRFFPAAQRLGLSVQAKPISQGELFTLNEHDLWALTVLGSGDAAAMVAAVAAVTGRHGANIVSVRRLADEDIRAAELIVDARAVTDVEAMRRELLRQGEAAGADIALARENAYRKSKRIVLMDADSTLVAGEMIDELARRAGVAEQVAAITRRAMEGELDFATALTQRVALLRGLKVEQLEEAAAAMPLTPGAQETIAALKALGLRVGVISGGFTFFVERLRKRLGLDYAFGNILEIQHGALTGRLLPPLLDAEGKAERLREIARAEGVPLSQVVGVGDGANDIPMLQAAGLGVAFRAKEAAHRVADGAIHRNNLQVLLVLLGVSPSDLRALAAAPVPAPGAPQPSSSEAPGAGGTAREGRR